MTEQKSLKFNPISNTINKRILRRATNQRKKGGWSQRSIISISSLIVLFLILLIPNLLSGINTNTADLTSYTVTSSTVTIDGVINSNEYSSYYKDEKLGVELYSEHTADTIYFGIICPAEGWCAIGFNVKGKTAGMANADIKFGTMENGSLVLSDRHSRYNGDPPKMDPTSNIVDYAGTRQAGKTTFEFSIYLNNGTEGGLDQNLVTGQSYTIIYAFHNTDDFTYHGQNRNQISFLISAEKK